MASTFTFSDNPSTVTSTNTTITSSSYNNRRSKLLTVQLGDEVTNIGTYAFFNCIVLTSITIPNSVTSIGYGAFDSCNSLASIIIPNSVTSIEDTAFYNCTSLASISVDSANNNFSDGEGVLFNKNKTTLIAYPNAKSSSYTIPNSVTSIGAYAFRLRTSLASVTIGNGVTGILDTTFYNCSSLISVTIGNSVTSIGSNAFFGCTSLASVIIPNSVTSISVLAFYNCGSLTNLTIPKSVTSIGSQAFENCMNLVRINFLGNAPSVGATSFVATNVNLKMYRNKNFVTGWSSTFGGKPVVLISDNVVKSGGSGKLIGKKRSLSTYDPDSAIYINNVEIADGQALEETTKNAINDFVVGCKSDNIWDAIKSSCILAGARTLAGALVPLKGTAPTNVNGSFVSGNYSRSLGLKGNGSTKYLNTNRGDNSDPKDSQHLCVYHTDLTAYDNTFQVFIGSENSVAVGSLITIGGMTFQFASSRSNSGVSFSNAPPLNGFKAISRFSSSQSTVILSASVNTLSNYSSSTPGSQNIFVFAENVNNTVARYSKARIAFYSIGENLDLSLYKARINTLMSTISALT